MNLYERILELCKISGDTMYSLSKYSGVSESVLSRLKTQSQSKLSKKNLILLANYFCVNEDWLETGEGDREAPGLVDDTIIRDERLHLRILELCQNMFGDNEDLNPGADIYYVFNAPCDVIAAKTNLDAGRIREILYDKKFPTYSEVLCFASMSETIDANWLFLGKGNMYKSDMTKLTSDRMNKLIDTIATLQEAINAKSGTIALLNERIKELEKTNR